MAKISAAGNAGLRLGQVRLGAGERGALISAWNVVSKEPGVLQPREGYTVTNQAGTIPTASDRMFYDYVNKQVLISSTGAVGLSKGTSSFSSIDSTYKYCAHTIARNTNYLLSDAGLRKINVANNATEIGGVPEALDLNIESLTGASGWFEYGTSGAQAAYRVVFGVKLSNSEFFLGAPSGRGVAIQDVGAGTSRDVVIRFSVPGECTTSNFYQVYRTQPSSSSTTDPGDEMFLIYEDFLTSTNISDKYVEFTDRVPNGNGGTPLYTSPSQKGILQSNVQCEASFGSLREGSLASYAGCVWASSYRPRSNITINLLSVLTSTGLNAKAITATTTNGSPTLTLVSSFTGIAAGMRVTGTGIPANTTILSFNSGAATITMSANATASAAGVAIVASDIITIAGVAYYAHTAETIANREFLVSTDSSAAKAVRLTAESLVRVINRNTTNTNHYAIYTSGPNDLPGRIYIFMRSTRNNSNTVQASAHGTAWSPNLTTAQTLESKEDQSIIVFSKPDEPHAYPYLNFIKIPENAAVVSMSVLRAALLVWTTKGLYRITGDYGNFVLDMMDETVRLIEPGTSGGNVIPPSVTTVVNNTAFAFTTRGVVGATETGVEVVSEGAVEPHLTDVDNAFVPRICFGNPLDLFVYVPTINTSNTQATLVYNVRQKLWTVIEGAFRAGVFAPQTASTGVSKMYFTTGSLIGTYSSNISHFASSFVDVFDGVATSGTILSVDSAALTVTFTASSDMYPGSVFKRGTEYFVVTSVDGSATTVGYRSATGATPNTGAVNFYYPVIASVQFGPLGSPDPATTKHYRYLNLLFDGDGCMNEFILITDGTSSIVGLQKFQNFNPNNDIGKLVVVGVASDLDSSLITPSLVYGFYDESISPNTARFIIPQDMQRASILNVMTRIDSYKGFRLYGCEVDYEAVGDKTRR